LSIRHKGSKTIYSYFHGSSLLLIKVYSNYLFFQESKVEWYLVTKDAADLFQLSPLTNKEQVIISDGLSSALVSSRKILGLFFRR
ncbi:MAG: hypothetical protein RL656_155, partial [Bacteroidota bacterium]